MEHVSENVKQAFSDEGVDEDVLVHLLEVIAILSALALLFADMGTEVVRVQCGGHGAWCVC